MATEIKYQICGQLMDNIVARDNTEEVIPVPVSVGIADERRIISEMMAEDSGVCRETILHVHELEKRVVKRLLMSGYSVNAGLYYASPSFRGVIEDSVWNPQKNSIEVNFNMGADLRRAVKDTTVNIVGEKGAAIYIGGVADAATRAQDATATAGRAFTLVGRNLRVAGTDGDVGITLTSESGTVTRITDDLFVLNDSLKVIFIIPAGLAEGTYRLRLATQYGRGNRLLKSVRSVEKLIYVGTAFPCTWRGTNKGNKKVY